MVTNWWRSVLWRDIKRVGEEDLMEGATLDCVRKALSKEGMFEQRSKWSKDTFSLVDWPSLLFSYCYCYLVTKLCPTLCDPMDCSPPSSTAHRISQARILEWVAISFSRGSFLPRNQTHISCIERQILYRWAHQETPADLWEYVILKIDMVGKEI